MASPHPPRRSPRRGLLATLIPAALLVAGAFGWISTQDDAPTNGASAPSSAATSSSTKASTKASTTSADAGTATGADSCPLDTLPKEAHKQVEDILTGAPPDDGPADGKHFGNYEGLLPQRNSSYYREYTVKTPGLSHRGERRLVVGGGSKADPDVWYYTDDHFESFCRIPDAEN